MTACPLSSPGRDALEAAAATLAAGTGPVAVDAERASGYRYGQRAYLVQIRRDGSGSFLVDPVAFDDLSRPGGRRNDAEWVLHAASQDLPCLSEIGLRPARALRHRARRPTARATREWAWER